MAISTATVRVTVTGGCSFNCECEDPNPSRTLGDLSTELQVRLGFSAQMLAPGMKALLVSFLQSAQRALYRQYKVLRTERFYTWDLKKGVKFYDLAENADQCSKQLDPRMITWAGVSEGCDQWSPLVCGIPPTLYGNPSNGLWPTRYEIRQCIEVWPTPSDDRMKLRIKGHFGLDRFEQDDDQCTIDDEAVLLHALARAKAHYGHADASNYERDLQRHIQDLNAGAHQTRRYVPGSRELSRFGHGLDEVGPQDWSQWGGE